jgi:hypothetical protein
MRIVILAFALVLSACASAPRSDPADLDAVARDYVRLQLEIGTHEDGYIDAYFGDPAIKAAAEAAPRALPALAEEADRLLSLLAVATVSEPMLERRRDFLRAHLVAARFRIDMIGGARAPFATEAQALFGVTPELKPLSAYDPVLARIEALVPGDGPLADRVQAFRDRYAIPSDRLEAVMQAAIAECRRRTLQHIALPAEEAFTLEFVANQSWSGYNWYQGSAHSLIQINTDFPVFIDRALDLGCHEGYPGHHTHNTLLEYSLVRGRGWVENTVFPLFSPISFIAEGEGNAGIDLTFPAAERLEFEARVLFPLAGLDPASAPAYAELRAAMKDLQGARMTIGRMWLDGEIASRDAALDLIQRYQLVSRARADQSLRFTEHYRSYIINYGIGEEWVAAHLAAAGDDPAARWDAMARLLSEPTLPSDLRR